MILMHLWQIAENKGGDVIGKSIQGACTANGGTCPNDKSLITVTIPHIVNILLYLVAAISVLMIVIGGLRYVISAGNPSAVNGAKDTILYAVVGLVLAVSAYAIVSFATGQFGI